MDKNNKFSEFKSILTAKLISDGFQEGVALTVASFITPHSEEGNIIYAECKNGFYKDTIINAKKKEINDAARQVWGKNVILKIQTPINKKESTNKKRKSKTFENNQNTLFENIEQNKPPIKSNKISDLNSDSSLTQQSTPFLQPQNRLIPEMTFDTFIRGQSNMVAYSACEAVTQNPGKVSNPLFIYGSTGLGKTHLLHSVGNAIKNKHKTFNIMYVTSGDFMNELISSIRFGKQENFRQKYRLCDVLLVDDIQFLENKDTTQLEFFHTFNELYRNNKQIIITSDKYPKDIPNIEDRLKSRFLQGLIADIEPPGFEDRLAILEAKAKILGLKLTSELLMLIATHVKSNVRELQGILNNLIMEQSMTGTPPTLDSLNVLMKRIIKNNNSLIDINTVQKLVANHFGIKISEMLSANRAQRLVLPRHIAMYLSKEILDFPTTEIAEAFGRKDHTTVIHAIHRVNEFLKKDESLLMVIKSLKNRLIGFG